MTTGVRTVRRGWAVAVRAVPMRALAVWIVAVEEHLSARWLRTLQVRALPFREEDSLCRLQRRIFGRNWWLRSQVPLRLRAVAVR